MFKKNNYWIERPTYHIKAVLGELQVGNLNSRCEPLVIREFNEIGTSINAMAKQLQETIRNEYELKLAQKNLQLQGAPVPDPASFYHQYHLQLYYLKPDRGAGGFK